ncbi:RES family NAD+ phosphorylase (plasmid) [Rhodococcus qingshengii]
MGEPLRESARDIADSADADNEDCPLLYDCSFCDNLVDPKGPNTAILWGEFIDLIRTGLRTLYVEGSENGNPPTGGGDQQRWFTWDELVQDHGWAAVGEGGGHLLRAIAEERAGEWWTDKNFGWDKEGLPLAWKQLERLTQSPKPEPAPDSVILTPASFLKQFDKIVTWHVPDSVRLEKAGLRLWRGRTHPNQDPALHSEPKKAWMPSGSALGSSPVGGNNRFSPWGISMFYGAPELATALSELTSAEDRFVTAGEFVTQRNLLILDLTTVDYEPSIFSPGERGDYQAVQFLWHFTHEVSKPVDPGEDEGKYKPTQYVVQHGIQQIMVDGVDRIDGIKYHSAKLPGAINYVLFFDNMDCGDCDNSEHLDRVLLLNPNSVRMGIKNTEIE